VAVAVGLGEGVGDKVGDGGTSFSPAGGGVGSITTGSVGIAVRVGVTVGEDGFSISVAVGFTETNFVGIGVGSSISADNGTATMTARMTQTNRTYQEDRILMIFTPYKYLDLIF
jgi:hypothetical protein